MLGAGDQMISPTNKTLKDKNNSKRRNKVFHI